MNGLQIFKNNEFGKVRTVMIDGKVHFVAKDVAKILDYVNTNKAIKDHCRWVTKCDLPHPQNAEKKITVNVIPQGDVIRLIVKSDLPAAEKFESWIFDEVIPTVLKTGSYSVENWVAARISGKKIRLQETDVIKQLIEYAEEQGSTHANMLYVTYTKLAKKILPVERDSMNSIELNTLSMIENIILQTIRIGMNAGKHYKAIYQDCKERLEQFKNIAYLDTIRSLAGEVQKSIA